VALRRQESRISIQSATPILLFSISLCLSCSSGATARCEELIQTHCEAAYAGEVDSSDRVEECVAKMIADGDLDKCETLALKEE